MKAAWERYIAPRIRTSGGRFWAFGVVLMEMLTGKTVYAGKTVSDSLAGVLAREPEWGDLPEETPRSIRRLLERCLEKEPRQRLRDIGEARIAIEAFEADPAAEATSIAQEVARRPGWQRLLPWTVAASAVIVAAALTLLRVDDEASPGPHLVRAEISPPEGAAPLAGRGGVCFGASAVHQRGHPDGSPMPPMNQAADAQRFLVVTEPEQPTTPLSLVVNWAAGLGRQ